MAEFDDTGQQTAKVTRPRVLSVLCVIGLVAIGVRILRLPVIHANHGRVWWLVVRGHIYSNGNYEAR